MKFVIAFGLIALVSCSVPWEPLPKDAYWVHKHEYQLNQTRGHNLADIKVVFLGDSITEGWHVTGKSVWKAHYENRGAVNHGIGGDKVENVLWRIEHGIFEGLHPKLVVLMIGTNNLGPNTSADIAKGIHAILDAVHVKAPNSKILLLGILPRLIVKQDEKVHEINKLIHLFADFKRVHYLDMGDHFEKSIGHEYAELYNSTDHVHLVLKGYEMWYQAMEPTFAKLIV